MALLDPHEMNVARNLIAEFNDAIHRDGLAVRATDVAPDAGQPRRQSWLGRGAARRPAEMISAR